MQRPDAEALAREMFDAYNQAAGGLTWDGKPIPPWDATGPKVQANWRAAAQRAISVVLRWCTGVGPDGSVTCGAVDVDLSEGRVPAARVERQG